ncbi:MAG: hypothetical protein GY870_16260 [archaeon]|nr:hypothetical protein [archaeon]
MTTKLPTPAELIALLREAKVKDFELVDKKLSRNCQFRHKRKFGGLGEEFEINCTIDRVELGYSHRIIFYHYVRPGDADIIDDIFWLKYKGAQSGIDNTEEFKKTTILGTSPNMERVMAFVEEADIFPRLEPIAKLVALWSIIDHKGILNFFELIKNAGDYYEELYNFCKSYIL